MTRLTRATPARPAPRFLLCEYRSCLKSRFRQRTRTSRTSSLVWRSPCVRQRKVTFCWTVTAPVLPTPRCLSQIEQQEFGVVVSFDGNHPLVFDCRSVAFAHLGATFIVGFQTAKLRHGVQMLRATRSSADNRQIIMILQ
jgi:hypothetical protein